MYLIPQHLRSGKLGTKFSVGVFLGREDRTGQVLAGPSEGVWRSPKFLRVPVDNQFSLAALDNMRGLPWEPSGGSARRSKKPRVVQEEG